MLLDSILNFVLIIEISHREVMWKQEYSVTLVEILKKWFPRRSFFGKVESQNFFADSIDGFAQILSNFYDF